MEPEEPKRRCYWPTKLPLRPDIQVPPHIMAAATGNLEKLVDLFHENAKVLQESNEDGVSVLMAALMHGQGEIVKWLLAHGPKELVFMKDKCHNTALHYAIYLRSLTFAKLLIEHGADPLDVGIQAPLENRCLHLSMLSGRVELAQLILSHGASLYCKVQHGPNPLHSCLSSDSVETFKWAVSQAPSLLTDQVDAIYRSSVRCGSTRIIKWLVENGYVKDLREHFILAATVGALDLLRWMSSQVDITGVKNADGMTPLLSAARDGKLECLKFLETEQGGNEDIFQAKSNNGATALVWAASRGRLEVVKYLMARGVSIIPVTDTQVSVLHYSAGSGHLEVVRWLLDHGAPLEAGSSAEYTPLRAAAASGYLDVSKLILAAGAKTHPALERAAVEAAKTGSIALLEWMKEQGLDWTKPDYKGKYPTMGAIRGDRIENLAWLLAQGTPLKPFRQSPLSYALVHGNVRIAKYLITECGQPLCEGPTLAEASNKLYALVAKSTRPARQADTLDFLYEMGLPLYTINSYNYLHAACAGGSIEAVKWFIRHGLSVLRRPSESARLTPIQIATSNNHTELVKWLFKKTPFGHDTVSSVLALARAHNNNSLVRWLTTAFPEP